MPSPSAKLFRLSHLRKVRECEQVAAVCYRTGRSGIEFLLIRTGKARWIFPKGGVEPGLSHAQSAALEAFEEAGVHGRMEEASFARYSRKRGNARQGAGVTETVSAHLCEVTRLVPPEEANRNPTWFSVEKAKKRLLEGRPAEFGAELVRIVDRAVARIERLDLRVQPTATVTKDALQRVRFEGSLERGDATVVSSTRRFRNSNRATLRADLGKVLQLGPALVVDGKRTVKSPASSKKSQQ